MRESSKVPGAFLCDYDTFRNIYRLQARSMLRTGSSIHIALLTLTDLNGDVPHTDTIRRMMASFQEAVVKNLRKGDVVSVYSSTQLVIMLPMTSYENGQRVLDRLEKQFDRLNRRKELKLIRMLHAVEPVEEELKAFVTR